MHGMDTSEQSMQELFQTTAYMQHVKKRGNKHTIMLGFSDGTKDGGYVKANWSILKTKENLTSVCKAIRRKARSFLTAVVDLQQEVVEKHIDFMLHKPKKLPIMRYN